MCTLSPVIIQNSTNEKLVTEKINKLNFKIQYKKLYLIKKIIKHSCFYERKFPMEQLSREMYDHGLS